MNEEYLASLEEKRKAEERKKEEDKLAYEKFDKEQKKADEEKRLAQERIEEESVSDRELVYFPRETSRLALLGRWTHSFFCDVEEGGTRP